MHLRIAPAPLSGVKVDLEPFEPIDAAVRRFRKVVARAGVFNDRKRHEYFVKKSARRRAKQFRARRRKAKYGA